MSTYGTVTLDLDQFNFSCRDASPPGWLRTVADRAVVHGGWSPNIDFVRWIADQVEAQVRPPRIPEPGLWGVVEAIDGGEHQPRIPRMYIRDAVADEDAHWTAIGHGVRIEWDDLIDPTLIRPGIEEPT